MITPPRRDPQAGITLIETLVVLTMIGIGAGASMMATGSGGREVQDEAVELARALSLGVDEALITGRPLALRWDARGYSFVQITAVGILSGDAGISGWPAAASRRLGLRHDLPEQMALRIAGDAEATTVILSPGAVAPTVALEVSGPDAFWTVTFDGFSATAFPGAPA